MEEKDMETQTQEQTQTQTQAQSAPAPAQVVNASVNAGAGSVVIAPATTKPNELTFEKLMSLPPSVQEVFAPLLAEQVEFEIIQRQAKLICATSGNKTDFPQAVVLASYARAHKMTWLEVTNRYCVISGKICEGANSVRARLKQAGVKYEINWGEMKDGSPTCYLSDESGARGDTWNLERARNAGLASKDVWKKYPREMVLARATTSFVKAYYPELLTDVEVREEVLDYLPDTFNSPKMTQNSEIPAPKGFI